MSKRESTTSAAVGYVDRPAFEDDEEDEDLVVDPAEALRSECVRTALLLRLGTPERMPRRGESVRLSASFVERTGLRTVADVRGRVLRVGHGLAEVRWSTGATTPVLAVNLAKS